MKNNTFFKLFIIIILALILRLWYLDKPEGLWNDEYVGWLIASQKDWGIFIKDVFNIVTVMTGKVKPTHKGIFVK